MEIPTDPQHHKQIIVIKPKLRRREKKIPTDSTQQLPNSDITYISNHLSSNEEVKESQALAEAGGGNVDYCSIIPPYSKLPSPSISELDPGVKSCSPGHTQSSTLLYSVPIQHLNSLLATHPSDPASLERAAKLYRNAASLHDATCTWSGQLPYRHHKNPLYSSK